MRTVLKPALALLVALVLSACVPEAPEPERPALSEAERAACIDRGGVVGIAGLLGGEFCAERLPDAGQACSRAADCSGYCEADSRTCSVHANPYGCHSFLDDAGEVVAICVD